MNTENPDFGHIGKRPEDEGEALAKKLSWALQENNTLRDRLAELDIKLQIETVELKKDIETLEGERDELTKENEFLLEDYSAKDHKIQELLRQIEIKQLMINETSSYLSTATDRIKNLERQCSNLEAHYAEIYSNTTASEKIDEETSPDNGPEPRNALIEDIRKEFEESLGQKDLEIESLHLNMEKLKKQNKFCAEEKTEIKKDTTETVETPAPLENTLLEMEHSLTGLEQRISRASEIGSPEKEEILMKLEDAQREIFSLREYHQSLLEALRDGTEQVGQVSACSAQEFEEKLDNAEKKIAHLESALTQERMLRTDLEDTMQRKDMILQELHEHFISDTERLQAEAAGAREAAERAEDEIGRLETISARSKAEIAILNQQIAEQQLFGEAKSLEAAELKEKSRRLEEDHQRLIKTSEAEISAFQNIISLRGRELSTLACRKEELEEELSTATSELAQQKNLVTLAEKTSPQHEEISRLRQDNEALSAKLQAEVAGAREAAERAEDEIGRLETISAHSNAEIAILNQQIAEQQLFGEAKSREAAELKEKSRRLEEDHQRLIKTSEEEISTFQNVISLRDHELKALTHRKEELEEELSTAASALAQQKNLTALAKKTPPQHEEISRLRQDNEALSAKLQAKAAERAENEIGRLETISARSKAEIAILNQQIAEQQLFGEAKNREAAELREKSRRLEEDHQRLIKTSEEEISTFQNIISLRDHELKALTHRKKELEEELSTAASALAQQKNLTALAEKTPPQHEEIDRLSQDNEALSARLAGALQKTATMEDIKTAVSLEIKRLFEKMESLKDERMADRVTLKNNIDKSFSMIVESTYRLEQAITESLPFVKRLEEISSVRMRNDLPAVYTAVPQELEKTRSSMRGRQLVGAAGLLLLLIMTAAIFFRQDVSRALSEKGLFTAAPKSAPWETGTKQAKSGQYEVTLIFLNKEAVQVLGFSDIIPDADLALNTFALIEVKSISGCIPEDFVASPEKNISFLDNQGTATPLNDPGALSRWKKIIYKQNACRDKKAGAVYMKHIISAVKRSSIRGLAVRELAENPIILH